MSIPSASRTQHTDFVVLSIGIDALGGCLTSDTSKDKVGLGPGNGRGAHSRDDSDNGELHFVGLDCIGVEGVL